jgi:hypothetical protein
VGGGLQQQKTRPKHDKHKMKRKGVAKGGGHIVIIRGQDHNTTNTIQKREH